ncbi:MAG: tRNA (N(6)-L-threonylcarbamoyladenosine(37)-C(2))-methylthiotransferase MtaB [Candidatus Zixiibacteriota bacterium]
MTNKAKKVAFFTVGCRLNQYETQAMAEALQKKGFKRVDFSQPADLYLINTCTVTAQSDYSSRQAVYRAHRRSPDAKILLTGCYAQLQPEFLKNLSGVNLVVGNEQKKNISQIASALLNNEGINIGKDQWQGFELGVSDHFKHTRALVKIQDGCNDSCSYCVVPQARGREKSRQVESILSEIGNLTRNGFKEVVLTGVHAGKYKKNGTDLYRLTKQILENTEVERIRFSSIQPRELTPELIDLIVSGKRICRHLHIPLQSGNDRILKTMNRNYSTAYYKNLVEMLKEEVPDICIGADVIVGFPGEKDQGFENTCEFIQVIPLSYLHVFSYSDREGTTSSLLPNKIDPKIIRKRSELLHEIGRKKWETFLDSFVGEELEILVEKRRDKKTQKLIGLTDNYIQVMLDGDDSLVNKILAVNSLKREGKFLSGRKRLQ